MASPLYKQYCGPRPIVLLPFESGGDALELVRKGTKTMKKSGKLDGFRQDEAGLLKRIELPPYLKQICTIASVLYGEGVGTSSNERLLIASVISNRIGVAGIQFCGRGMQSSFEVVTQPNQFESYGDSRNKPWLNAINACGPDGPDSRVSDNPEAQAIWRECWKIAVELYHGTFEPIDERVTFFHRKGKNPEIDRQDICDERSARPESWDRRDYWTFELKDLNRPEYKHVFYTHVSKKPRIILASK